MDGHFPPIFERDDVVTRGHRLRAMSFARVQAVRGAALRHRDEPGGSQPGDMPNPEPRAGD
jgi:hypothetical protein